MPPIVLVLNIPTIAVPKRRVFVISRIYHLPHSFRKQKICFKQCRFLFQKLRVWKSKLTCGQERKNWVEPLRSFVLSLREAVILEKGENYFAWKEFFQKIGSNPILKDK